MSLLICLDPGHVRDYNRGAYTPYYEGTKMYDLAVMLKEEIEKYSGMSAFITRTDVDDCPSLYDRATMAKTQGARCFLSLHTNACSTESVKRIEIYRSVAMPDSEALAWKLMDTIADVVGADVEITKGTSIQTKLNTSGTDYYGVLRYSTGGSVQESFIVEHVFHTNYNQSEWMYNDTNLRKLAVAEAKTLAEYYGYTDYDDTVADTTTDSGSTGSSTTTSTDATGYTNYTVVSGDSWWKIAANQLGSGSQYKYLAEYNDMSTDDMIHPGDVLMIPC